MKIVIAGGTGFIGNKLVRALTKNKCSVILLTRKRTLGNNITSSVRTVQWDAINTGEWANELNNADAIINLSGESLASGRWTAERKNLIVQSRIQSTRAIVEAISRVKNKPPVLLNASAVGYYGNVPDARVTEDTIKGRDFLAETCYLWEKEAQEAHSFRVRVVLLRTGLVLGKEGGVLTKFLTPFKMFIGGPLGSGKQWLPWIHQDDLIKAIIFIIHTQTMSGPVNLTAPKPVTMKEFSKLLGETLRKPSIMRVPSFILKMILGEMSEMVLSGQNAIPKKLLQAGFEFQCLNLRDALQDIIAGK